MALAVNQPCPSFIKGNSKTQSSLRDWSGKLADEQFASVNGLFADYVTATHTNRLSLQRCRNFGHYLQNPVPSMGVAPLMTTIF